MKDLTKPTIQAKKHGAYHKIYAILSIMPSSLNLNYNKRYMDCIPFIFDVVRVAVFPVNHKPNPIHYLQGRQKSQQHNNSKFW